MKDPINVLRWIGVALIALVGIVFLASSCDQAELKEVTSSSQELEAASIGEGARSMSGLGNCGQYEHTNGAGKIQRAAWRKHHVRWIYDTPDPDVWGRQGCTHYIDNINEHDINCSGSVNFATLLWFDIYHSQLNQDDNECPDDELGYDDTADAEMFAMYSDYMSDLDSRVKITSKTTGDAAVKIYRAGANSFESVDWSNGPNQVPAGASELANINQWYWIGGINTSAEDAEKIPMSSSLYNKYINYTNGQNWYADPNTNVTSGFVLRPSNDVGLMVASDGFETGTVVARFGLYDQVESEWIPTSTASAAHYELQIQVYPAYRKLTIVDIDSYNKGTTRIRVNGGSWTNYPSGGVVKTVTGDYLEFYAEVVGYGELYKVESYSTVSGTTVKSCQTTGTCQTDIQGYTVGRAGLGSDIIYCKVTKL